MIDLDHVTYFIFFITVFSVSHAALDGGTQVDGPALKDSSAAERRSIWLNYAVLFYTVIAFAAVLFVANAIIFDLQHPLGPDAAETILAVGFRQARARRPDA